ncbi:unnamed protein product [Nippostrongylus brasiliensis]|uniref:Lethal (1) G0222 (inferred by orthology to a D. melanogaster protein) n=1 Tax=Nippostrongylus brasiliensis TaxID=27835 RepID=A0A158QWK7_NIPBR|nr:unnamed protein product [Nippostrongylus brasiliensis]
MGENAASPVYAVYFPADIAKSPKTVFTSLKEAVSFANSPEGKSKGARFNRFGTEQEAMNFFESGEIRSPLAQLPSTPTVPSEPTIPHPSVAKVQMNDLKRAIEKGTNFSALIESNPRFLVNTNGDTAAIVMEGFRFNALHIAARHGKSEVVERVLDLVSDLDFLSSLYGTSKDDVRFRADNILASYLNTPDKGNWETPLHLAAKFGHVDVVKALIRQPLMEKNLPNKGGETAMELACSRYTGEDKRKRKEEMECLLGGFFVAIYRSADNMLLTETVPRKDQPADVSNSCDFYFWQAARALLGLKRKLKMKWIESWSFLNELVDIRSEAGLKLLDSYLGLRKATESSPASDSIRKRLQFDDEDGGNLYFREHFEWIMLHYLFRAVPNDLGEFFTPPATPPPVFLFDHPTKVDNDVMMALSSVPQDQVTVLHYHAQLFELSFFL